MDHRTEQFLVHMGPQHPSTHGVLRLDLTLDGERILGCEPVIGYLHSSLEKLAEKRTYVQYIPFSDRYDYLSSMHNNWLYCRAIETRLGIEVPRRAEYLRVLVAELQRIASHLVFIGTFGNDLGAWTLFLYAFRERELIIDLFQAISGGRLLYNYMRFGGVKADLTPDFEQKTREFVALLPGRLDEYDRLFTQNRIMVARTRGLGVLTPEVAFAYGCTGPNLRASGVGYDLRRVRPYGVYPEFDFDVCTAEEGDSHARFRMRVAECRQSLRIIEQCLDGLPSGPVRAKTPRVVKLPPGEAYTALESSRGELGCYLVSDGSDTAYRLKWRGPSFANLQVLPELVRGHLVADVIAVLGSIDLVVPEVDR
jgi:NADH-quinone oxidoreductase subunit D